ncbi:UbiA family prenyltransferase [Hymenobacter rubripertinctus]|uniref:Prenyltransferase n=1 Tax=Hymenobacter rubripertinctus TaxID=2029981 RepID=A0A418QPS0_9BACT|nr:UbiA family prenyltransferase [Hymenobacter rubripertinctus]RIY07215.1 hypothetical protein D0T11_16875 [Hymenobacter rubripertinctus]
MSLLRFVRRLAAVARFTEWWGYKFAPIMAICFATALLSDRPIWPLSGQLLLLLLALTVAATYVSLLNDWTDRVVDKEAGKENRLAQTAASRFALLLGSCLAVGAGFLYHFWQLNPAAAFLYLGTWVVYSLYSLPPVRLKGRGVAGVLADAAGAHFFPQLLGVMVVGATMQQPLPLLWIVGVGVWALACGLRNIIWHQLSDGANDHQAGIRTFVTVYGAASVRRMTEWGIFPLEIAALCLLLYIEGLLLPVAALLLYAGLVLIRGLRWKMTLVIAQPGPNPHVLLNEFYEFFYPLALLLVAWWRHATDGWAGAGFLLLFGAAMWPTVRLLGGAAWRFPQQMLPANRKGACLQGPYKEEVPR